MTSPQRIQRKRTKGWRKPVGAIDVTRPGRYGNPISIERDGQCWRVVRDGDVLGWFDDKQSAAEHAVNYFLDYVDYMQFSDRQEILDDLRGHDLMCWCKIGDPCHADAWLKLANA